MIDANKKALNELLKYFKRKKYTKMTVDRWTQIAVEYLVFLEKNGKTIDDVGDLLNSEGKVVKKEEFGVKEYLDTKTKYSARYLNYLCHVLKRLYKAWEKHFPIDNEEFPKVSGEPKRLMLTTEQLLKAADAAKAMWLEKIAKHPNDITGLRDYAMVLISIDCGARRIQISEINIGDYDLKKGILFIPAAKGGRDTYRPLSKVVRDVLVFYLKKREKVLTKEKAMFLSNNNERRITVSSMSEIFQAITKRAGVYEKGIGFHAPRRGKSLRLKKAGLSEEERNDVFGWKTGSKMSHIYGELDHAEVQKKAADADTILKQKQSKDSNKTI
jgi:integrase